MKKYLLSLLLCLPGLTIGQEITLEGPLSPISKNCLEVIYFHGISSEELGSVSVTVVPNSGVSIKQGMVEGEQALLFRASKPNKYTITVGFNVEHAGWRKKLGDTVREATAAGADVDFLERLRVLNEEVITRYPVRSGMCVVEVLDEGHTQPPPDIPDNTAFETAIKQLTLETLQGGGTVTSATAISGVFNSVSSQILAGEVPVSNALATVNHEIRRIFSTNPDEAKWSEFRTMLSDAIDTLRQDGLLTTKEQFAKMLKEVSNGINLAVKTGK